ncbi:MAG: alpha amylase C-terminal domain-containing protein, partial [Planctomycetales bacterium]|nr:alpha amylase C-terminal domain-containing protein [Planctomycetales bacterium]
NRYGGRENIDAIEFIKKFNAAVYEDYPDTLTFAEESTSWPMVSRPTYVGGLGFGLKWNMGWMNDTLAYMKHDPVHRSYHHNQLTFGMMYAHTENFILPFSHDEVVHMKGSMLSKMPGDGWQKFANLRLLYGYMYAYQGKKLLFMGCEFGQGDEWNHDKSLDWYLLEWPFQRGLQEWVRELNQLLRDEPAFYEQDFDHYGFEWIDCDDAPNSVISFIRWPKSPGAKPIVCVCNFTPIPRYDYRVGVPFGGTWLEIKNSDASMYGGSNMGNNGFALAEEWGTHGRPHTLRLTLPPLSVLYFKPVV